MGKKKEKPLGEIFHLLETNDGSLAVLNNVLETEKEKEAEIGEGVSIQSRNEEKDKDKGKDKEKEGIMDKKKDKNKQLKKHKSIPVLPGAIPYNWQKGWLS